MICGCLTMYGLHCCVSSICLWLRHLRAAALAQSSLQQGWRGRTLKGFSGEGGSSAAPRGEPSGSAGAPGESRQPALAG